MWDAGFLTVDEVAHYLKVTRQTVSKYIRNKNLNAVKINKSYRIASKDFEDFLAQYSTVEEPHGGYLQRTKNCFLDYQDKADEFEIIYSIANGEFELTEQNHSSKENRYIFGDNFFVLKKLVLPEFLWWKEIKFSVMKQYCGSEVFMFSESPSNCF